jgi:uncharacterized repeat protein (TIGR01451 family)
MKRSVAAGALAALAFVLAATGARGATSGARGATTVPLLDVALTHDPSPSVVVGHDLTFTITAKAGAHDLTNVIATDRMDASFTYVSGEGPGGAACTSAPGDFENIVTCPVGAIGAGGSATATIVVQPQQIGGYVNNAKAKGFDAALSGTVFSDEVQDLLTVDPATSEVPSLSVGDASVTEGSSGTTDAIFTLALSTPASTDVSVDYATADGSATAPGDYTATSGTLVIPMGSTSATVAVPVVGDTAVEPDETFTMNLSNAANATIADAQATGTILNDDAEPTGGPVAAFSAAPDPAGCEQVVSFDGSGSSDGDSAHHVVSYTWNFGDGATASGAQVSHAFTTFGSHDVRLTVGDDATPAKLANVIHSVDVSVDRPPVANGGGPYVIELGDALSLFGGASADADTGCGDSITAYAWDLNDDRRADATGASPTLSGLDLAELKLGVGVHQAVLTVTDSLGQTGSATVPFTIRQAQLSIGDASVTEGNTGTATATFAVSLSFASTHTATVQYTTADDTATAPSDYQAASGTLTFAPGTTTQNVSVTVKGDAILEPSETFTVGLSSPTTAAIADGQGVGTILNDDLPTRTLQGTVTKLTPFAPGGGPGESPFAGVQVILESLPAICGGGRSCAPILTPLATTDAQGRYSASLGSLNSGLVDRASAVLFRNAAGGEQREPVDVQPAPATTTLDARMGASSAKPPQFVFGQVLGSGRALEQLAVKVYALLPNGSGRTLVADSTPFGQGSPGGYRIPSSTLLAPKAGTLVVTLYQDGFAVDSTYVTVSDPTEIQAPDLHALPN